MVQPVKYLSQWLENHADHNRYLFTSQDLKILFPTLSENAFKSLLSRSVKSGLLLRVCRGLYTYKKAIPPTGCLLFHAAARLRAQEFNYLSLESVLSEVGVISQIPFNRIFIMSSGCSNLISCGPFGSIEFVHTSQKPTQLQDHLSYDERYGLWRASVPLALRDMKATHRNCDLINWEISHEFV